MFSTDHNSDRRTLPAAFPPPANRELSSLLSLASLDCGGPSLITKGAAFDTKSPSPNSVRGRNVASSSTQDRLVAISNRQLLVRLESSVTPRKQSPAIISNRHFWEGPAHFNPRKSRQTKESIARLALTAFPRGFSSPAEPPFISTPYTKIVEILLTLSKQTAATISTTYKWTLFATAPCLALTLSPASPTMKFAPHKFGCAR
jgi:hypothetical protein